MSERHPVHGALADYYSACLSEHGPVARGVDWKDERGQARRHQQFLRLLAADTHATVLDVGCGYGSFLTFLRQSDHRGAYIGYDVSASMIEAARTLHGESEAHSFHVGTASAVRADYAVANGILNVIRGISAAAWPDYVWATLDALHASGRRGFGFNLLSTCSDPSRRRDDLFYADPVDTLRQCLSRYGRHVALMQDYGLWEFTILVRRAA